MSLKRLFSVVAVCLLGALVLSGQAVAQQPDDTWGKVACEFTGLAGTVGPGENGVNSIFSDLGQGQAWDSDASAGHTGTELMDTDPGTFTFEGDALCAGVDLASENKQRQTPEAVPLVNVDIDAKGIFDNLICGTGDAKGTAMVTELATQTVPNDVTLEVHTQFAIQFVAGKGKLSIVVQGSSQDKQGGHSFVDVDGPDGPGHANNIDQGQGQGVVDIVPVEGQKGPLSESQDPTDIPCVGQPDEQQQGNVTKFEVSGAFETSLAGEGDSQQADPKTDSDI